MPPRTKMINGKRYYFLGTYNKKPSVKAVQRTGASVYERRLHKSFPVKASYGDGTATYYHVYYRDVKDPKKYKIAQVARRKGIAPNQVLRGYGSGRSPKLGYNVFGQKL